MSGHGTGHRAQQSNSRGPDAAADDRRGSGPSGTSSTDERRKRPRRHERFADPAVAVVWAALETLDYAQLLTVYRHLEGRITIPETAHTPQERRLARALSALQEAADLLEAEGRGRLVSVEAYRRLRVANPRAGWPSDGSIRRWVGGSWNKALRAALLDPVPEGDAVVPELGPRFLREECLAAVREYAKETGDRFPTQWSYLQWAKRPEVRARSGRRPTSGRPFQRLFSGWSDVLTAAGLITVRDGARVRASSSNHESGGIMPRSGYGYSDEEIGAALREAADRVGRAWINTTEYDRTREEILAEEVEGDEPLRPLPSGPTIQHRYPTWDEALVAAGLEPARRRGRSSRPHSSPKRFSDEEILAAIRVAAAACDGPLTTKAYHSWRDEERTRQQAAGGYGVVPGEACIQRRFGGFAKARRLALGREDGETDGRSE